MVSRDATRRNAQSRQYKQGRRAAIILSTTLVSQHWRSIRKRLVPSNLKSKLLKGIRRSIWILCLFVVVAVLDNTPDPPAKASSASSYNLEVKTLPASPVEVVAPVAASVESLGATDPLLAVAQQEARLLHCSDTSPPPTAF